jgi:hypothetical protein
MKTAPDFNELNSFEEINDTLDELTTVYSTIFFNRNIEFRTMEDEPLFIDTNNDG